MNTYTYSPAALTEELGQRIKQARLNTNMTQIEVAELAGVSRKVVINAEKGKIQLESLVAIMMALDLIGNIDNFLPKQELSPIQLAKLRGKKRQRASGKKMSKHEESSEW
ncbi:Transcriptional regulator [Xenorhabdus bovienii str. oregonense]|uniref:Transcriptional regulator n=1 Tax=Xenorhabdus bovienii str. oregonense TaxID=1398202 RepID=A0A077NTQ5_XENBV|nr:helix-turn-helix transcriptional regulator [Xenorhabdus bovienii]CDH05592.1 Transcriptional regulator [Xenorhabdus bovienii str. oregonense]